MKFNQTDYQNLIRLFRYLFRSAGKQVLASFLLQIFTGFTKGIGLLMLIPLLSIVGIFQNQATNNNIGDAFTRLFHQTHIPEGLGTILAFYVLVVTLNAWLNSFQTVNNAKIQQRFVSHLKNRLYTSIGHSEWSFVSRIRLSELAHVITSEVQLSGQVIFQSLRFTSTLTTVLAYVAVAFMLSAQMASLSIVGASLLLLLGRKKNKMAYSLGKDGQKASKKVFQIVVEHLSGIKVAKSFAEEDKYISEFIGYSEEIERKKIEYARLSARTSFFFSFGTVVLLSFYVFLAIEVISIQVTSLLVLIYIFSNLLPKVSTLQTSFQSILQALPAFSSVNDLQSRCNRHHEKLIRNHEDIKKLGGTIELRNITFRYGQKALFENVSLVIPRNSIVCFTGESGSGKTTMADLILGLLKPSSGTILIDGQVLNEEILYNWRKSIGYVTQESYLFNDSIRNNLLWTNQQATEAAIREALEISSAYDMVQKFESGLETVVGDRGARLSGGERQRLALARALVRKPTLLLLDEATSALDPVNEKKIIDALKKLKGSLTILIISHSPEIHLIADNLYRFENGRIRDAN